MSRDSRLVLLAALCLASALVGMELMATAVALPRIVVDLADWTQLRRASWIVNGYLLAYIAAMPLAGRAARPVRAAAPAASGRSPCSRWARCWRARRGSLDELIAGARRAGLWWRRHPAARHRRRQLPVRGAARDRGPGRVSAANFLGMALGPFLGATVLEHFDLGAGARGRRSRRPAAYDLLGAGVALGVLPRRARWPIIALVWSGRRSRTGTGSMCPGASTSSARRS